MRAWIAWRKGNATYFYAFLKQTDFNELLKNTRNVWQTL